VQILRLRSAPGHMPLRVNPYIIVSRAPSLIVACAARCTGFSLPAAGCSTILVRIESVIVKFIDRCADASQLPCGFSKNPVVCVRLPVCRPALLLCPCLSPRVPAPPVLHQPVVLPPPPPPPPKKNPTHQNHSTLGLQVQQRLLSACCKHVATALPQRGPYTEPDMLPNGTNTAAAAPVVLPPAPAAGGQARARRPASPPPPLL